MAVLEAVARRNRYHRQLHRFSGADDIVRRPYNIAARAIGRGGGHLSKDIPRSWWRWLAVARCAHLVQRRAEPASAWYRGAICRPRRPGSQKPTALSDLGT